MATICSSIPFSSKLISASASCCVPCGIKISGNPSCKSAVVFPLFFVVAATDFLPVQDHEIHQQTAFDAPIVLALLTSLAIAVTLLHFEKTTG